MKIIPAIGQPWPEQGGVNAGLMRGVNSTPDYYLIIATEDSGKTNGVEWGGYDTEVPSASCEFDGLQNTTALLKADTTHPAAEWAAGVIIEGHNDFYLPARREQSLMYANCPELFDDTWYWSSTHDSAHYAWFQYFGVGHQGLDCKHNSLAARAVRRYYPLNNSAI